MERHAPSVDRRPYTVRTESETHLLQLAADRSAYYARISPLHLSPLWEQLHSLVPREPVTPCVPCIWRYETIRPHLMDSAQLITAEEAERRVLVLENPGLLGRASITQSLYAGLQLIMPGEIAPPHRHVQSALRFVLEGQGAHTAVGGERTTMRPGDFIITPSWEWHGHGNEGVAGVDGPVVWLDGLDIPIVRFFDTGFAQDGASSLPGPGRSEGRSGACFGYNMAPVRHTHTAMSSPLFSYPFERSRDALAQLQRSEEMDLWDGWKLRYINPLTGGAPLPTVAAFLQLLPAGFRGKNYQATDGTVFSVVEGTGFAEIAGQRFDFAPRDTFVVPSWAPLSLNAWNAEVTLFSFSDRAAQVAIGIHREAREDLKKD